MQNTPCVDRRTLGRSEILACCPHCTGACVRAGKNTARAQACLLIGVRGDFGSVQCTSKVFCVFLIFEFLLHSHRFSRGLPKPPCRDELIHVIRRPPTQFFLYHFPQVTTAQTCVRMSHSVHVLGKTTTNDGLAQGVQRQPRSGVERAKVLDARPWRAVGMRGPTGQKG